MNADLYQSHPLFSIDYMEHKSDYSMSNFHYHNSYELYFLEQGFHHMLTDDSIFDVGTYDVALFKPNMFHRSQRSHGCARTCIYFTERFLRMYFTERAVQALLSCFDKEIISLSRENFPKVKKLLLLLEKEDVSQPNNRVFIYLADILNILNESKKSPKAGHTPSAYENFAPILSYINQNYNKIEHIQEIADMFYISKFYLCRVFKEATGLTLTQYINNIKIQHACNMLANTNLSILDIGAACGYNSSMYFCKTFKQALSVTPSEFRKNARLNM
jgi:AraC-like DNA-binding protein